MANIKRKQVTCRCEAYAWPHRLDGGKCRELYNSHHESGYEADSIKSLGLTSLFALDNRQQVRF